MPKTAKKPTAAKRPVKRAAPKKLAKKDTAPFLDDKPKTSAVKVSLAEAAEDEEMKRVLDQPMTRTEKLVFWCLVIGLFLAGVGIGIVIS